MTIEVRLYDISGLGSYTVLPALDCSYRDELSKRGSGQVTVPKTDAAGLVGRAIVKFHWQAAERFGILIDADSCTVAATDTAEVEAQRMVTASGLGLLTLLGDATVLPEYGLQRASGDDRRFGYMSLSGGWHSNVTWAASLYTPIKLVDYGRWPVFPSGELKADDQAAWIGVGNITVPPGYSWFRRQFTTSRAYGAVRLLFCADDTVEWYLDGELISNVEGDATILDSTYTGDVLNLAAGTHVLAARVTNAFQPRNSSGVLVVENADGEVVATLMEVLDPLGRTTAAEPRYGDILVHTDANWECFNADNGTPGWHWAQILLEAWNNTYANGPFWLIPTFTGTLDSNGNAWTDIQDLSIPIGTSLLDLCEQAGETIDFWVDAATMNWNAYIRKGVDRALASPPVELRVAENLAAYDTARASSPVNVAIGHLADGTWLEVIDTAGVVNAGGRIERRFDIGATADAATARTVLARVLAQTAADQITFTARPGLLTGATPYQDYELGDTIVVPGHRGDGQIPARVLALNVARNGETVEAYPELVPDPSSGVASPAAPADPTAPTAVYVTTPGTASSGTATLNWTAP